MRQNIAYTTYQSVSIWQSIINSQRLYVRQIEFLYHHYAQPILTKRVQFSPKVGKSDGQDLFSNLIDVLAASRYGSWFMGFNKHRGILSELERQHRNFPYLFSLGKTFLKLLPKFKVFYVYSTYLHGMVEKMNYLESIPEFSNFLERVREKSPYALSLSDFLHLPVCCTFFVFTRI